MLHLEIGQHLIFRFYAETADTLFMYNYRVKHGLVLVKHLLRQLLYFIAHILDMLIQIDLLIIILHLQKSNVAGIQFILTMMILRTKLDIYL